MLKLNNMYGRAVHCPGYVLVFHALRCLRSNKHGQSIGVADRQTIYGNLEGCWVGGHPFIHALPHG